MASSARAPRPTRRFAVPRCGRRSGGAVLSGASLASTSDCGAMVFMAAPVDPMDAMRRPVWAADQLHLRHMLGIGRGEGRGAFGARRIDPDRVDLLLGGLRLVTDHFHLPLPAQGEDGPGFAEIEAC